MGSQLKKAHRTHALAQPAGVSYPGRVDADHPSDESADKATPEDLFAQLCALRPEPGERCGLLGVSEQLDASWRAGRLTPVLRAHRRALLRAVAAARTEDR